MKLAMKNMCKASEQQTMLPWSRIEPLVKKISIGYPLDYP